MSEIFPENEMRLINQASWATHLTNAVIEETAKASEILKELKRHRERNEIVDQALIEKAQQIIRGLQLYANPEEPYAEQ